MLSRGFFFDFAFDKNIHDRNALKAVRPPLPYHIFDDHSLAHPTHAIRYDKNTWEFPVCDKTITLK